MSILVYSSFQKSPQSAEQFSTKQKVCSLISVTLRLVVPSSPGQCVQGAPGGQASSWGH